MRPASESAMRRSVAAKRPVTARTADLLCRPLCSSHSLRLPRLSSARSRLLDLTLALGLSLGLAGCAPAQTHAQSQTPAQGQAIAAPPAEPGRAASGLPLWADFSDEGVVWSDGRTACVARAPQFTPICPRWPSAPGPVAWHGPDAWVALPQAGLAVTVDGAAQSIPAGRVVAMTATRLYREDGSAVDYAAAPAQGVAGRPEAAMTVQQQDYVLQRGYIRRVGDRTGQPAQGPYLYLYPGTDVHAGAGISPGAGGSGPVASAAEPTVVSGGRLYRLRDGQLQELGPAGDVTARLTVSGSGAAGALGLVGGRLAVLTPAKQPPLRFLPLPLTPGVVR